MADEGKFKWLRPASKSELLMDWAQRYNMIITSYMMTLSSAAPLEDDHVRMALVHLFRKVPVLRMCFRERDGDIWACQMDREEIDFKVIDCEDPLRILEDTMSLGYESASGPLWRARLLRQKEGAQCPMEELQEAFPYTRVLILGNHHGIADGTCNLRANNLFLSILDDVIAGRDIDDEEQLGECDGGEETEKLLLEIEKSFGEEELREAMEEEEKSSKEPTVTAQVIPPPPAGTEAKTRVMLMDLDRETTKEFLKKCKEERVTVHSGFTALLNGTTADVVKDAGGERASYSFKEAHTVNMRRYWPQDSPPAMGCHVGILENRVETPSEWKEDFWNLARGLHSSLHDKLREKVPVRDLFILLKLIGDDPTQVFAEEELSPEHEYITANLRNVDVLVPYEGQNVRLTHLVRTTSNWKDCWLHMFHTLRGRFLYCLCYSGNVISEQTARKFIDTLFENLKAIL